MDQPLYKIRNLVGTVHHGECLEIQVVESLFLSIQLGQQFKMTVVAKDKLLPAEVSDCCLVAVM